MKERDVVARIMAAGAVVIGGALTVDKIVERQRTAPVAPQADTQALTQEAIENLVGDCMNENILRSAVGAPPISMAGCIYERQLWTHQLEEQPKQEEPNG